MFVTKHYFRTLNKMTRCVLTSEVRTVTSINERELTNKSDVQGSGPASIEFELFNVSA